MQYNLDSILWMITGDWHYAALSVVVLVSGLVISQVLFRQSSAFFERFFPSSSKSARILVGRILRIGVLGTALLIALEIIGVDINSLLAVGTVVLVGLGLALQEITRSIAAGILLLMERQIGPGDVIIFEDEAWRVIYIHLRTTRLENHLGEMLVVPNYLLASRAVRHQTHKTRCLQISCTIGVAYDSDLEAAFNALHRAALSMPGRDEDMAPAVLLQQFGNSSIDFLIRVPIRDPWAAPELTSALNLAIYKALKRADITIPFPQLDVHHHNQAKTP